LIAIPKTRCGIKYLNAKFPTQLNQGIFCWNREEKKGFEQGVCNRKAAGIGRPTCNDHLRVDEVANFRGFSLQFLEMQGYFGKMQGSASREPDKKPSFFNEI